MESHLGNGVGSSRSAKNVKNTSSSVDWLNRDMHEMRIRDKTEADEERVSLDLLISFFRCLFDDVVLLVFDVFGYVSG